LVGQIFPRCNRNLWLLSLFISGLIKDCCIRMVRQVFPGYCRKFWWCSV